jgi:adenosylcobinamide-GDP ribazoletransferase
MQRGLAAALLAVEFLTVLRLRRSDGSPSPADAGLSLFWFPAVGLLVGIALVATERLADLLWFAPVVVALVLTANAAITGGLHLDGLADSADGIFGGHTSEQRLAIMRDSRIGTFGVVALVALLLIQFSALVTVAPQARRAALLAAPLLGRLAMVLCIRLFPYARPSGLGHWFKQGLSSGVLTGAVVLGVVLLAAVAALDGLLLLPSLLVGLLAAAFAARRLGGLTGDVYGACGILVEAAVMLTVAAWPEHDWLAPWLDR